MKVRMGFQHTRRKLNISVLVLDGRALFVHFKKGTVLHHINFKAKVNACSFSPDGK
jgi:hypothetical protein